MKSQLMLALGFLMLSASAADAHAFGLKRTNLGASGSTYYDNVTQSSDLNFVYTAEIQLGTPAQTAEVLVDINYPTTIIFENATYVNYNKETVSIAGAPWYLNPFYLQTGSGTYLKYSQQSSVSNIISCGFRFRGTMATDNLCLNNNYKQFCYNSIFVNVAQVQNNYWLNVAQHPNIGGILGAGYFQDYTQYGSFWNNMFAKDMPTKFAFAIVPDDSDWSWIPNAPDTSTIEIGSQIMIGSYDPSNWQNVNNPYPLDI